MSIFNANNTEWKTGKYSLLLGQKPALYDSINMNYERVFGLYKRQVGQRWVEDEFDHEQSRLDLLKCPKNIYQTMLMNLAFQWELDSVAARAIAPVFAPFITNSEFWAAVMEITNMEVIHALSYSEIIRQCCADPSEVFALSMESDKVLARAETVIRALDETAKVGHLYALGQAENDQELYNKVFKGWVALFILERLQFMSSFAATFAVVEQGYFQSIGKKIQKIMIDEIACHAALGAEVLKIEMATERGKRAMLECSEEIEIMIDEAIRQEFSWSKYLFSEGRTIVGLNQILLNEWVVYNAKFVYKALGLECPYGDIENPLPWMKNWIDIDATQSALQEVDNANYKLFSVVDDVGDIELDF